MYGQNESNLKETVMRSQMTKNPLDAGLAREGSVGCDAARPSLMERVNDQRRDAQQKARQADRLAELQFLLEKNPEVARILDLLESVRG